MLEDETIRFKVPKRENKIYRKEERDGKIYTEDWRKPEFHKGDHHDTFDPFQVSLPKKVQLSRSLVCLV